MDLNAGDSFEVVFVSMPYMFFHQLGTHGAQFPNEIRYRNFKDLSAIVLWWTVRALKSASIWFGFCIFRVLYFPVFIRNTMLSL